jgi:hypothetical protein
MPPWSRIDRDLIDSFFSSAPSPLLSHGCHRPGACHCAPKINLREAQRPTLTVLSSWRLRRHAAKGWHRCGLSDGEGGSSYCSVQRRFCGRISQALSPHIPIHRGDNRFGTFIFSVVHWIKAIHPLLGGVLKMTGDEQVRPGSSRRMSMVLWDMFTGSAPYREIFVRTLDPRFLGGFAWESARAAVPGIGRRENGNGTGRSG